MATISVIIPLYNCKNYIDKCLSSLLAQTYGDFEAILIDDGSTDNSGKICDWYAEKDPRFKVLYIENRGVAYARQLGIENSCGKYISFIDSDDRIEPDMFKILYDTALHGDYDIVSFNFFMEHGNHSEAFINNYADKEKALTDAVANEWAVVWKYLFRRDFIMSNGIKFITELRASEDYLFTTECLCKAKSFIHIPNALYHYNRENWNSLTHNRTRQTVECGYTATNKVENLLETANIADRYADALRMRKFYVKNQCSHFGLSHWHRCYPEVERHIWDIGLDIPLYRRAAYTALSIFGKLHNIFQGLKTR